ncbi:MAG: HlyD family efflux transporter periplasmic adaptor subunit [Ignavibacteria bacterium]
MAAGDALPPLRQELSLHEGPVADNGAPTWVLQDPVRHRYFRIEWLPFEILSRWQLGDGELIAAAVERETTLAATPDDVAAVLRFMLENELLQLGGAAGTAWYADKARRRRPGAWSWLLHHYLFFRVPLLRPDAWLARHQHRLDFLYSRRFAMLTLAALLLGGIEVARQWERFVATLVDTFTLPGMLAFGAALVFAKTLHEFGHAFTAKRHGCRVPVMGVAFIVLWPLAYTDVTDAWKLRARPARLAVGAAGIAVELALAAWATLAWALLPDGLLRGMAFVLATSTWMATLTINASPFMRFDGYFLLCDALEMPNLHARAFALARWRLRELLFGLGEAPPEFLPAARRSAVVAFAWATWLYRLVVFFGIAVIVYHMFAKALGIFLGAIEVGWFIALPVWRELRALRDKWPAIRATQRSRRSAALAGAALALVAVPWSFQIQAQGVLKPGRSFPLIATRAGQVVAAPAAGGAQLAPDDLLMRVESPELEWRRRTNAARSAASGWAATAAALDTDLQPRLLVLRQESITAQAALEGDEREAGRLAPAAPFAGTLVDVPPDLRTGDWVARNEKLGLLIDPAEWRVEAYLSEEAVERVSVGDGATFLPEAAGRGALSLRVEQVDHDATRALPEGLLASPHGGAIPARQSGNQVIPDRAVYRVSLRVLEPVPAETPFLRGQVVIRGAPATLLGGYLRAAAGLLIKESGF